MAFALCLAVFFPLAFFGSGLLARNARMGVSHIKHHRLETLQSPKLVLIGGSNLHYGLNSPLLEEKIGLPVVNMGIQGSIGLLHFFAEVEDELESGDTLVVALEHGQLYKVDPMGETALYSLVSVRPQNMLFLNTKQWLQWPRKGWVAIGENLKSAQMSLLRFASGKTFFRERTNEHGDHLGHKGKKSILKVTQEKEHWPGLSKSALTILTEKAESLSRRGVCVQLTLAPIAKSALPREWPAAMNTIEESLTFIGDWMRYVYDDSHFFDTTHHLLFDKRDKRTLQLAEDLSQSKSCLPVVKQK